MAAFERLPVTITADDLLLDGFGDRPQFAVFVAECDGVLAGYALYHASYSSFQGRAIFLEDLFVSPSFRGRRVARALLAAVAAVATQQACFGIVLNVLGWNDRGLEFFTKAGATVLEGWKTLTITGDALHSASAGR